MTLEDLFTSWTLPALVSLSGAGVAEDGVVRALTQSPELQACAEERWLADPTRAEVIELSVVVDGEGGLRRVVEDGDWPCAGEALAAVHWPVGLAGRVDLALEVGPPGVPHDPRHRFPGSDTWRQLVWYGAAQALGITGGDLPRMPRGTEGLVFLATASEAAAWELPVLLAVAQGRAEAGPWQPSEPLTVWEAQRLLPCAADVVPQGRALPVEGLLAACADHPLVASEARLLAAGHWQDGGASPAAWERVSPAWPDTLQRRDLERAPAHAAAQGIAWRGRTVLQEPRW